MSKYRILRLITWLPTGGIERKIAAVLPRLNRDLFDVHLCCIRERGPLADHLERAGIPVHVIPFRSRLDPLGMYRLRRLVRKLKIDLVHSHMYRSNVPDTLLKIWEPKLVSVGHYHNVNTWESRRQLRLDRMLALRRDANIAVSEAVRLNVVQTLNIPEENTATIYNGVDLDEFRPVAKHLRRAIREKLGFKDNDKLVISVARLVRQKNQELIIRAAADIVPTDASVHFMLVGGGPDEERLRALVASLHLQNHVHFLGRRDDVPQLLASCDVSVLPSLREGFSNAILESMACALPVVASNVGGNAEVIDHGVNSFLCDVTLEDEDDPAAVEVNATQFLRYLRRLLIEDEFRLQVGQAALVQVKHFSLDVMISEVEQLYLHLLEDGANDETSG